MKKLVAVAAAVACASLALVGCAKKDGASAGKDASNKLVVWSFTDELDGMITKYFQEDGRFKGKYEIEYSLTPTDQTSLTQFSHLVQDVQTFSLSKTHSFASMLNQDFSLILQTYTTKSKTR